jgi:hypothetical protein
MLEKGANYGAILFASLCIALHQFAPNERKSGSPQLATRFELA